MPSSFRERLRQLIDEEDRREADGDRFDRLEKSVGERFERLEKTLTESRPQPAKQDPEPPSAPASTAGDGSGSGAAPGPEPEPEPEPELPLERVKKLPGPAKIHTGDDEPATVKYLDADTGEEKTRKGRRRGQPYGYEVESVDEEPGEEPAT